MKKLLSLLALLLCSLVALAQSFSVDGINYIVTSADKLTVGVASLNNIRGDNDVDAWILGLQVFNDFHNRFRCVDYTINNDNSICVNIWYAILFRVNRVEGSSEGCVQAVAKETPTTFKNKDSGICLWDEFAHFLAEFHTQANMGGSKLPAIYPRI